MLPRCSGCGHLLAPTLRPGQTPCEVCRTPITPKDNGRPPRYCSSACRSKAYRIRRPQRELERAADLLTGITTPPKEPT